MEGKDFSLKMTDSKDEENILLRKISKRFSLKLTGYKYLELTNDNSKNIILNIFKTIKSSPCKNNIIINFETTIVNLLSNLNNKLETDKPFMLFNFPKENFNFLETFKNFKYPQYISYLILSGENDPEKLYIKIVSYILEKSAYYKEKGNELNKYLPNSIYKEPKGFLYLNILLTGESRAGKSSFINRMFNKLVSYETPKLESATSKINSYELYPNSADEEQDKVIKNGFGGIKIFDTPGLTKTENLNSFELIKKKLNKIFNEIHIIYFFIKAQSNLEHSIDMLKYIKNKNIEREKNKLNKIPMIFIKNGEDLVSTNDTPIIFQELKKELEKYNLLDLYDPSINENINKQEYNIQNFFDEEDNNNNKNYDNYIKGNIIQIHIPTGKNITKVFSTTKKYIIKNNEFLYNKDIQIAKNNTKKLISFYIKEKLENKSLTKDEKSEYNELYKICCNIIDEYKKNCSLLYNLDILNIKSKFLNCVGNIGFVFSILFPNSIIPIFIGFSFLNLRNNNIIDNMALKYGFGKKDLIDYGLNKHISYIFKENKNNDLKNNKLENKCQELFEDILYYIGPIQCLLKAREFFEQIIHLLDELSNKHEDEWNKFHIDKI